MDFEPAFQKCSELAAAEENLEHTFENFRDRQDLYHFLAPVGDQLSEPDHEALNISSKIDHDLTAQYLKVPKPYKGYGDRSKWVACDKVDSRHIMMSTIIFSKINPKHIIEIGGGFGNWVRLNHEMPWHHWTIIDLPFVSKLQQWYIKPHRSGVEFIDTDHYQEWVQHGAWNCEDPIDLVIGAHSLAELSWEHFDNYMHQTVIKSKYFFYAANKTLPDPELLATKMKEIIKYFKPIKIVESENGMVMNCLFERKA